MRPTSILAVPADLPGADRQARRPLPRAMTPQIRLQSPKITRQLTTDWFARRVDDRHRRCLARDTRRS